MRISSALLSAGLLVLAAASCDGRITMGNLNGDAGTANAPSAGIAGSAGMRGSSVAPSGASASGDADVGNADARAGASSGGAESSAPGTNNGEAGSDGSAAGFAGRGELNVGSNGGVGGDGGRAGGNRAGDGAGGINGGGAGGLTGTGGAGVGGAAGASSGSGGSGGSGGKPIIGCGNGLIENGENCDDANQTAADGCSATCKLEGGFACAGTPSLCSNHLSCVGMPKTCGATGNADCCGASRVTGGTFNRLHKAGYPATVSDFVLDNFEITVGRFRKFVEVYSANMIPAGAGKNSHNPNDPGWDPAMNSYLPADSLALIKMINNSNKNPPYISWTDSPTSDDIEHRPINYLTWTLAQAFCIWDGGRLPTQAEWNFAAVGG